MQGFDIARFEAVVSDLLVPCRVVPLAERYEIRLEAREMGPLVVAEFDGLACRIELYRQDGPGPPGAVVKIQRNGACDFTRGADGWRLAEGDIALWTLDSPVRCSSAAAFRSRVLILPGDLLATARLDGRPAFLAGPPRSAGAEAELLALYTRATEGSGTVAASGLGDLVGRHLLDLAVATLARSAGVVDPTSGRGMPAVHLDLARSIVGRDFADPLLSGRTLARRLGVPATYLERLFDEAGDGLSAELEAVRLADACRRMDFADEARGSQEEFARLCGFRDAASFRRAWRRTFGCMPPGRAPAAAPGAEHR